MGWDPAHRAPALRLVMRVAVVGLGLGLVLRVLVVGLGLGLVLRVLVVGLGLGLVLRVLVVGLDLGLVIREPLGSSGPRPAIPRPGLGSGLARRPVGLASRPVLRLR